jgi:YD repeat-containing protein
LTGKSNISSMKTFLIPFFFLYSFASSAQYYYNDIIGTREINRQQAVYLSNKVKTVSASGYDQRGAKTSEFSEFREVKENGMALKISTFNQLNKVTSTMRFNKDGRVTSISDTSLAEQNNTRYEYDENGMIVKIENTVTDSSGNFNQIETHTWLYQENDKPALMWRVIRNAADPTQADSLKVSFMMDEKGNIAEERTFRKAVETGYLYYYYDDNNRMTDIVRYNRRFKKLVPDIMFEFDEQNRVIQKITTTAGLKFGYLIWRYIYDEKGLKTKEALFNNDKQLTGKIEFSYTFGQ